MPRVNKEEVPLVAAAAHVRLGYNVVLRLVLRGEIVGRQDERGRWMVSVRSLKAWSATNAPPARRTARNSDTHAVA
jgi:hypothetical protein